MTTIKVQLEKKEVSKVLNNLSKLDSSATYQGKNTLFGSALLADFKDGELTVKSNFFVESTLRERCEKTYIAYVASNKHTPYFDSYESYTERGALSTLKRKMGSAAADLHFWVERV